MKLFLIHVGFYDNDIMNGLYEQHCNYFIVAKNFNEAKKKAKLQSIYKKKKMHIDGIQELNIVDGFRITLKPDNNEDDVIIYGYNQLNK